MKFADPRLIAVYCALLAGCAGGGDRAATIVGAPAVGPGDGPAVIGLAYKIDGETFTPRDAQSFDEVGYAGRLAADGGGTTANGEAYDPTAMAAAHRILPLPSYVEVTALATGRTILVRINDRGPRDRTRAVALTPAAFAALGLGETAAASGVRIRKTNPVEAERAALRRGGAIAPRIDTPPSLLRVLRANLAAMPRPTGALTTPAAALTNISTAPGQTGGSAVARPGENRFIIERRGQSAAAAPAPPAILSTDTTATTTGWRVQLGTFSARERAESLARSVGGQATPAADGRLWRVQMGPFASEAAARAELASMRRRGYGDAVLVRAAR